MASEPAVEGAVVTDTSAGRFQMAVDAGGVRFLADEPLAFGGLASGPNPYDLLAASLGACTAMTLRLYAERKVWPLQHVRVHVTHTRRDDARDLFTRDIALQGPLDPQQTARLLEIADRCPVHQTLMRGVEVRTHLAQAAHVCFDGAGTVTAHARDMEQACAD